MARRLLKNLKAEEDANKIAERYIGSKNVLADMQRDYGGALSGVRIHDDAAAAQRLDGVGRDGLAVGNDIFMRPGLVNSGMPEANGLLAHELSHVMQQGSGSVAYGSEQGGLLDWFRGWGKKKKKKKNEEYTTRDSAEGESSEGESDSSEGESESSEGETTRGSGFINWFRNLFSRKKKNEKERKTTPAGRTENDSIGRTKSDIKNVSVSDMNPTDASNQIKDINNSIDDIKRLSSSSDVGSEISRSSSDADISRSSSSSSIESEDISRKQSTSSIKSDGLSESEEIYMPYKGQKIDPTRVGKVNRKRNLVDWKEKTSGSRGIRAGTEELIKTAKERYGELNFEIGNASYFAAEAKARKEAAENGTRYKNVEKTDDMINIGGLNLIRVLSGLLGVTGEDLSNEEVLTLVGQLSSGKRISADEKGSISPEQIEEKDKSFDAGMIRLKELYYGQLKKLEATYGKMPTQLHPDDFLRQIPDWDTFVQNSQMVQDIQQMMTSAPKYFDFDNNPKDKEMKNLQDYYFYMISYYTAYVKNGLVTLNPEGTDIVQGADRMGLDVTTNSVWTMMQEGESGVRFGPQFDEKQREEYIRKLRKRASKQGWADRLFGIYQ